MKAFRDANGQIIPGPYTPVAEGGGTLATSTTVPQVIGPFSPTNEAAVVRLNASTTTFVAVGTAPIAANTDCLLSANLPEFIAVPAGQKLSVLAQTTAGTINWAVLQ